MSIAKGLTRRVVILVSVAAVLAGGCRRKSTGLSSMVNMADPSTATQLVSGFHAVEQNAWRWTMKKFSVVLKPPAGSEKTGATLRFRMFVSDDQIKRLSPLTLSADIDGHPLDPELLAKEGEVIYSRPVPPELLQGNSVKVNFALSNAREPDSADGRQLGVVAMLIGLQPR